MVLVIAGLAGTMDACVRGPLSCGVLLPGHDRMEARVRSQDAVDFDHLKGRDGSEGQRKMTKNHPTSSKMFVGWRAGATDWKVMTCWMSTLARLGSKKTDSPWPDRHSHPGTTSTGWEAAQNAVVA